MRLHRFIFAAGMVLAANVFAAPGLECDKPTYDFGEREKAESFFHTFVLNNKSKDDITIKAVKKSCSCFFLGKVAGKTVKPGESVKLKVKIALSRERETLKKQMYLVFDKGNPLVLTVRGKITKTLYWQPSNLQFKGIDDHKKFSSTIKLVHKGKPIRVQKVSCSWKAIEVTMDKKRKEETAFTIKFKTKPDFGEKHFTIIAHLDDGRTLEVAGSAIVQGLVLVFPELVHIDHRKVSGPYHQDYIILQPRTTPGFQVKAVNMPFPEMKATWSYVEKYNGIKVDLSNIPTNKIAATEIIEIETNSKWHPRIEVKLNAYPRRPVTQGDYKLSMEAAFNRYGKSKNHYYGHPVSRRAPFLTKEFLEKMHQALDQSLKEEWKTAKDNTLPSKLDAFRYGIAPFISFVCSSLKKHYMPVRFSTDEILEISEFFSISLRWFFSNEVSFKDITEREKAYGLIIKKWNHNLIDQFPSVTLKRMKGTTSHRRNPIHFILCCPFTPLFKHNFEKKLSHIVATSPPKINDPIVSKWSRSLEEKRDTYDLSTRLLFTRFNRYIEIKIIPKQKTFWSVISKVDFDKELSKYGSNNAKSLKRLSDTMYRYVKGWVN